MINQVKSTEFMICDPKEQIENIMKEVPFFSWCLEKGDSLSEGLLKVLANIFANLGKDSDKYKEDLQKKLSEEQVKLLQMEIEAATNAVSIPNFNYETIRLLGFDGTSIMNTPIDDIFEIKRIVQETSRGVYYDEKKRRKIECSTFTRYALTRFHLVQNGLGEYYVYSSDGYYKKAVIPLLKRLFREILDAYDNTMWSPGLESSYLKALEGIVPIHPTIHEGSPNLINFSNGILDIEKNKFFDHSPEYCTVNQLPYKYIPEAKCPKFIDFLMDIFESDVQRVLLVQLLLGYLFLREIKIQKGFIFLGSGSNGKSVLAEIITKLVGKFNVSTTPLSKLNGSFSLQNISGKLANISTENELKTNFNTQDFKMITAGDMVEIEKKYKDAYSANIYAKLIILLNNMMDSADKSSGYYRRLQIIPFNKTYYELKEGQEPEPGVSYMNPNLIEELSEELSGIFNYALEGLNKLKQNKFRLPVCSASEKALEEYKRQQNPMGMFVDECIYYSKESRVKRSDITPIFMNWLEENGISNFKKSSSISILDLFNQEIEKRGWQVKESKIRGDYYLTNIGIHS